MVEGRNPYRVVLDSKLNLKTDLYLFKNNSDEKTILITAEANKSKLNKINKFDKLGVNVLFVKPDRKGRIQFKSVLKELSKLQIASLLVEGGSKIYSSFIKQNLFDDILLFVSPKILGSGLNTFSEFKSKKLGDAAKLNVKQTQKIGDDILIELVK